MNFKITQFVFRTLLRTRAQQIGSSSSFLADNHQYIFKSFSNSKSPEIVVKKNKRRISSSSDEENVAVHPKVSPKESPASAKKYVLR